MIILAWESLGAGVDPDITIPNPPNLPNLTVLSAFADITGVPETLLAANITSSNPSFTENNVPTEPSTWNIFDPEPCTSNEAEAAPFEADTNKEEVVEN